MLCWLGRMERSDLHQREKMEVEGNIWRKKEVQIFYDKICEEIGYGEEWSDPSQIRRF